MSASETRAGGGVMPGWGLAIGALVVVYFLSVPFAYLGMEKVGRDPFNPVMTASYEPARYLAAYWQGYNGYVLSVYPKLGQGTGHGWW